MVWLPAAAVRTNTGNRHNAHDEYLTALDCLVLLHAGDGRDSMDCVLPCPAARGDYLLRRSVYARGSAYGVTRPFLLSRDMAATSHFTSLEAKGSARRTRISDVVCVDSMIHFLVLEITKAAVTCSDSGHSIDTGTPCFQQGFTYCRRLLLKPTSSRTVAGCGETPQGQMRLSDQSKCDFLTSQRCRRINVPRSLEDIAPP
jgi:hypothetical protein